MGLAGCSGGGDGDGDDGGDGDPAANADGTTTVGTTGTDDGTTTATGPELAAFPELSAGEPAYRRWQPGTGDIAGLQDAAYNLGRTRARRDALPAATYENQVGWAMFNGYVGVEFDELDGMIFGLSSAAAIYLGSFARGDVTERLEGLPYEQFDRTDGVDYYRWDQTRGTRVVGVSDAAVLAGGTRSDVDDPAETFVAETTPLYATGTGERPRLHEESELYARYTDAVGWPLVAQATPPRPARSAGASVTQAFPGVDVVSDDIAESVRVGFGQYLADGAVVERYWLWTTEDGPAAPADIRATFDDPEVRRAALEQAGNSDLAVRRDGWVVELALVSPVSEAGGGADPPLVAVEATVDAGTLTLEHFGGDRLPLARLSVPGTAESLSLGEGELRPGESVSVDLPDGAEPQAIVYSPPAADVTTAIAEV